MIPANDSLLESVRVAGSIRVLARTLSAQEKPERRVGSPPHAQFHRCMGFPEFCVLKLLFYIPRDSYYRA